MIGLSRSELVRAALAGLLSACTGYLLANFGLVYAGKLGMADAVIGLHPTGPVTRFEASFIFSWTLVLSGLLYIGPLLALTRLWVAALGAVFSPATILSICVIWLDADRHAVTGYYLLPIAHFALSAAACTLCRVAFRSGEPE